VIATRLFKWTSLFRRYPSFRGSRAGFAFEKAVDGRCFVPAPVRFGRRRADGNGPPGIPGRPDKSGSPIGCGFGGMGPMWI
jgi:hypothetical protein